MQFGAIVDKATLDALLTADAADASRWRGTQQGRQLVTVCAYLDTLAQLLVPEGGVLVLVTLRGPAALQAVLDAVNEAAVQEAVAGAVERTTTQLAAATGSGSAAAGLVQLEHVTQPGEAGAEPACGSTVQVEGGTASLEGGTSDLSEHEQVLTRSKVMDVAGSQTVQQHQGSTKTVLEQQGGEAVQQYSSSTGRKLRWCIVEHVLVPSASAHAYVCNLV